MVLVEEIRSRYLNEYKTSKFRLESDFKEDEQRKTDYHGRELFELLQNVDDAAVNTALSEVDVLIEYKNDVLTVANNGTVFTKETIERLCHGSASNKSDDYIGNKGTGFRSLLNWGKKIEIHSGGFHIGFSRKFADEEFCKLLEESELVREQKQNVATLSIPVLHCPFEAESIETEYDTVIRIVTDESFQMDQQNIVNQITGFDNKTLIFLPNITRITINTESFDKVIEKRVNKAEKIIEIEAGETIEKYLLYQNPNELYIEIGNNEKRKIKSSVAISLDAKVNYQNDKLYCFFPIRSFSTPLNCLMHATFELNTSRDDVPLNAVNRAVFKHLLEFVKTICEKELIYQNDRLLPIKTLTPTNKKSKLWSENGFNLFNDYLELLKDCKVIPTVNKDFVSIADKPKLITPDFPGCFIGDNFEGLLEYIPTTVSGGLLEDLARQNNIRLEYRDEELCQSINHAAKHWSTLERVKTFLWWEQIYKSSKLLPDLLKSTQGSFVRVNEPVYFVRSRKLDIPEWARITQLDLEFEEELTRQLKDIEKIKAESEKEDIFERVIARNSGDVWKLIPHLNFKYADASTILSPVNSSVDSYEKAKEFTRWLLNNYSSNPSWTPPEGVGFKLPSQKGTFELSHDLYFDKQYGNEISDKLFANSKSKAFVSINEIGIDEEHKVDLKLFIEKLGVLSFPKSSEEYIKDKGFERIFNEKYLTNKLPRNDVNERYPYFNNLQFSNINNLKEILGRITLRDVLLWIKSDNKLRDELDLKHRGIVSFNYTAKTQALRNIRYPDYKQSYIKYIFENTEWLEIDGEKLAPNQCIFAYPGLDISKVSSTITNKHLKELAKELEMQQKEMKEFLIKIGVKEKITEFHSKDFYNVLLKLPYLDQSGQISEKIYREIVDLDENPFGDSEEHQKFVNEGRVFTQNHNGKSYHWAKNSYFSSSIQVNVGNYHIMKTPLRNGNFKVFNSIFGVQEFKEQYQVDQDNIVAHSDDNQFQSDFNGFLVYAKAWGEKNANIKARIDNIRVNLVSQVLLLDNGAEEFIKTNYLIVRNKRNWLIYLDSSLKLDQRKISKSIEELFAQVANTASNEIPNQLGELYRDVEGRKFLVEKHFGSVDVINQISKNPIRLNFAEVLKLDYDSEELVNIDYNQFNNIDNSKHFVVLLKKWGFDVDTLKESGFEYDINLRDYWLKLIKSYISKNQHIYMSGLFGIYTKYIQNEQKNFLKEFKKFINFKPEKGNILNSVDFNVQQFVESEFPVITMNNSEINIDRIYNENFESLSGQIQNSSFNDFVDEHSEIKSLIYFLKDEYVNYIKKQFEENQDRTKAYKSVSLGETKNAYTDPTLSKAVVHPNVPEVKTNQPHYNKPQTRSAIEKRDASKSNNGKAAEELVRNKLKGLYDTLRWTSENSDIPAERNHSSIYDMEYQRDGMIIYVEVKAAINNFYMSSAEYNFAHNNAESYEIYLVDLDNKHINGPHHISEFEESKTTSQYKFCYTMKSESHNQTNVTNQ